MLSPGSQQEAKQAAVPEMDWHTWLELPLFSACGCTFSLSQVTLITWPTVRTTDNKSLDGLPRRYDVPVQYFEDGDSADSFQAFLEMCNRLDEEPSDLPPDGFHTASSPCSSPSSIISSPRREFQEMSDESMVSQVSTARTTPEPPVVTKEPPPFLATPPTLTSPHPKAFSWHHETPQKGVAQTNDPSSSRPRARHNPYSKSASKKATKVARYLWTANKDQLIYCPPSPAPCRRAEEPYIFSELPYSSLLISSLRTEGWSEEQLLLPPKLASGYHCPHTGCKFKDTSTGHYLRHIQVHFPQEIAYLHRCPGCENLMKREDMGKRHLDQCQGCKGLGDKKATMFASNLFLL
jgi:hypothetical protein